jgi:hypothetical protein
LPLAGNDDGFGLRSGSSQLHNRDHSRRGSNGHNRVHDDAQLAVVGVRLAGVQVRDLGNDQHRQQNQAKDGDSRQKAWPRAALTAEICLKSCQSMEPSGSILQKETVDLDASCMNWLHLSYDFSARRKETPNEHKRLN